VSVYLLCGRRRRRSLDREEEGGGYGFSGVICAYLHRIHLRLRHDLGLTLDTVNEKTNHGPALRKLAMFREARARTSHAALSEVYLW
jgi:hypothetical protein